ncbi:uncharacterized protein [Dermacentor albipictus]|uniref:uncharacterized protein isoform X1 n=1 Tax=Dermacentor albipictus TaxID=60249 RepID=UPI0038FC484B
MCAWIERIMEEEDWESEIVPGQPGYVPRAAPIFKSTTGMSRSERRHHYAELLKQHYLSKMLHIQNPHIGNACKDRSVDASVSGQGTVLKNGVYRRPDVCLSLCYATYIFLSFLELTCISQTLCDEAQKLKEAARRSSTIKATDSYFRQVEFLHYTMDPDGMRFSGAGFFPLDKPLILSIAGALITYTIIVLQTGEELTQRMGDGAASPTP